MFLYDTPSSTFSSSEDDLNDPSISAPASQHTNLLRINKSSQNNCSIRSCILWLCLFVIIVFFYLTTNCWSNTLGNIFISDRRYMLEKIAEQHSLGDKKKLPCPPFARIHGLLPSLMVRPLKNVSQSSIVQGLTVEKVKSLFKIADQNVLVKENLMNCSDKQFWNGHHESYLKRRQRLQRVCKQYGFYDRIFSSWHLTTNRRSMPTKFYRYQNQNVSDKMDNHKYCNTRSCPLLVNADHRLLTCFVQKVASTTIKHLYLYLDQKNLTNNITEQQLFQPVNNLTNFHFKVNDELYRISPTYLAYSKEANYYKTLFVRHPFVRVVSAFKDKAERGPEEEAYFYERYWNPLLDRLHGKQRDPNLHVTFREFVEELLLPTDPYQYDEHWAPIWTRCEPCFVHYDFIGKLETSEEDFRNFKSRANKNLINITIWENLNQKFGLQQQQSQQVLASNQSIIINDNKNITKSSSLILKNCQQQRLKYAETIRYLQQLSPKTLIELYKRYYLDFELFGYSLDELFETIQPMNPSST